MSTSYERALIERALLLDDATALHGLATVSLETQADQAEPSVLSYVEQHFGGFLKRLRSLSIVFGTGFSPEKQAKQGHIYATNPRILGQFRVSVQDPDYEHLFTAHAVRG